MEVVAFEFHLKAGRIWTCENGQGRMDGGCLRRKYFVKKAICRAILIFRI